MAKYESGDITKSLFGYVDAKSTLSEIYSKKAPLKKKTKVKLNYLEDQQTNISVSKNRVKTKSRHKNASNNKPKFEQDNHENTLFIGNLPIETTKKDIKRLVSPFGTILNVRFRSIPLVLDNPTASGAGAAGGPDNGPTPPGPKKVRPLSFRSAALIGKECLHPSRTNKNAYVNFHGPEPVAGAVATLNGQIYNGRHLRVDRALPNSVAAPDGKKASPPTVKYDNKRTIFVGNLPFTGCEEEDLWRAFQTEADLAIEALRMIRTKGAIKGVGCGFVMFKEAESVGLALLLNDKLKIGGRVVRIKRCVDKNTASKEQQKIIDKNKRFNNKRMLGGRPNHSDRSGNHGKRSGAPKPNSADQTEDKPNKNDAKFRKNLKRKPKTGNRNFKKQKFT